MYSEQIPAPSAVGAAGREKRRHVRVEHTGSVEFVGEGRRFSGQAVNISRTGMQVVVNLPESYASVRSITFRLPNAAGTVDLPCRLVRRNDDDNAAGEQVLGIEFSYESQAQLLLIENYVRELREREIAGTRGSGELRQIPRASCCIRDVEIDRPGVLVSSIDNISCDGLLMSLEGELEPRAAVSLRFRLPGDDRKLRLFGETVYVIAQGRRFVAGVRLRDTRETERARIWNFAVEASASEAVRRVHHRFGEEAGDPAFTVSNRETIVGIFRLLAARKTTLYALSEGSVFVEQLLVQGLDADAGGFHTTAPGFLTRDTASARCKVYFSFYSDDGSYYFKSSLSLSEEGTPCFAIPASLLRSEKRSHQRKMIRLGSEVELSADRDGDAPCRVRGVLVDVSWRGFLCEIRPKAEELAVLQPGSAISYYLQGDWGLGSYGVVRHAKPHCDAEGATLLRIGIEAGIRSAPCEQRTITADQWENIPLPAVRAAGPTERHLQSIPVRYRNSKGQEIAALVNLTRPGARAPVVVLPPAFGKKKESLAPVATTLLSTFAAAGRDLVTLRYDGINRPGESHNDDPHPARGSEMLHCRLSQGLDDLRTTLAFVRDNNLFEAETVILISSSMASLDVRKLLATRPALDIACWVNCMGIASGKSTVGRILGGLDIIGNQRMGVRNGVGGMLGYLVDLDTVASDMVESGYAHMTDARRDMFQISVPTLWMFGSHDRWVDPGEIRDIMSIGCGADRQILEIPVGHNMRSSEDASRMFKLVAEYVYEAIHGEPAEASVPAREELALLVSRERQRLAGRHSLNLEQYWKDYLLGGPAGRSGYDFCYNIGPFREFLDLEAELLAPRGGDVIADIGSGTGLLLQGMAARLARENPDREAAQIVAYDLVPDALQRAREKWEKAVQQFPVLRKDRVHFVCQDLDWHPAGPVHELLSSPGLGFDVLRNRVEGLSGKTVDLLIDHSSPLLHRVVRGCPLTEEVLQYIGATFDDGHRDVVMDLNRAARFIQGRLQHDDFHGDEVEGAAGESFPRNSPRGWDRQSARRLRFQRLVFDPEHLAVRPELPECAFSKIAASLFLSYVSDPALVLRQLRRALRPDGLILVSTMKPDSDVSVIFTDFVDGIHGRGETKRDLLEGARGMLNDAAGLFSLEEEGYFRFYSAVELRDLLGCAGFRDIRVIPALGSPPQATIVTGRKAGL